MKVAMWIAGGLLLIVAVLLLIGQKSVHAELYVDAPAEAIWDVLVDTESYAEWNPIFVSMAGTFAVGNSIVVEMKLPSGETTPAKVKVLVFEPGKEINQKGGYPGILTYDHRWQLIPEGNGTKVVQHEDYRGVAVPFWNPEWVQEAYQAAIEALSNRVTGKES